MRTFIDANSGVRRNGRKFVLIYKAAVQPKDTLTFVFMSHLNGPDNFTEIGFLTVEEVGQLMGGN